MERLLQELGPRVAVRLGDAALRAGAKPIIEQAKANLAAHRDTGNLADSLGVKILKGDRGEARTAIIGAQWKTYADPRRKTGNDIPGARAHLLEFGTHRTKAHPFLAPAFDARAEQALSEIGRKLGDGIEREALKLAGEVGTKK